MGSFSSLRVQLSEVFDIELTQTSLKSFDPESILFENIATAHTKCSSAHKKK
jgi:hypothetical protein